MSWPNSNTGLASCPARNDQPSEPLPFDGVLSVRTTRPWPSASFNCAQVAYSRSFAIRLYRASIWKWVVKFIRRAYTGRLCDPIFDKQEECMPTRWNNYNGS